MPGTKGRPKVKEATARLLDAGKLLGKGRPTAPKSATSPAHYRHVYVLHKRWQEQQKLAKIWAGAGLIAAKKEFPKHNWLKSALAQNLQTRARGAFRRGWRVGDAIGPADIRDPYLPIK